jgi:hypothetical protein
LLFLSRSPDRPFPTASSRRSCHAGAPLVSSEAEARRPWIVAVAAAAKAHPRAEGRAHSLKERRRRSGREATEPSLATDAEPLAQRQRVSEAGSLCAGPARGPLPGPAPSLDVLDKG